MAKKFNKKAFRDWLDAICILVVKERDEWTCRKCGEEYLEGRNCQWSHINSRKTYNMRWDLVNSLTLCSNCHGDAHEYPSLFNEWLREKYPYILKYLNDIVAGVPRCKSEIRTWREEDFLAKERKLLDKAMDLEVDPMKIKSTGGTATEVYQKRLIKKLKETRK